MLAPHVTPTGSPDPTPTGSPTRRSRWVTGLWWADGIAFGGGVISLLLGRLWLVPVELCDRTHGRMGHPLLWFTGLAGLAIAVLVVLVAFVVGLAFLVRRDRSAALGAGLAILGALAAGTACVAGVILVAGDAPIFCF